MKLKKRMMVILYVIIMTVSFLHPFYGQISCAQEQTTQAEEVCPGGTDDQKGELEKEAQESGKEEEKGPETNKEISEETQTQQKEVQDTESEETEKQPDKEADEKEEEKAPLEETDADKAEAEDDFPAEVDDGNEKAEETTQIPDISETDSPADEPDPQSQEMSQPEDIAEPDETDVWESEEDYRPIRTRLASRSVGISASDPRVGQENSYNCINGVETWTVPANGKYRISCYGGAGGDQSLPGDTLSGGTGSVRQGTIQLTKGTVLYINVGGNGLSGYRHSNGDEEGNDGSYNGGAAAGYDTSDLGNHGRYWTHGAGGGASDVRMSSNDLNSQIIVAGGGGGANKKTRGSNGDSGSYNGRRLEGTNEGGGGGYYGGNAHQGGSSYVNTSYFTEITEQNGGSTEGRVVIRVVTLFPKIVLSASREWTNKHVRISASVLSYGEGRPPACFSWEKDENGADIWTADNTFDARQNGICSCKIRDTAGNITEASWEVKNIDRLAPITAGISLSTEEWTDGAVTLAMEAEDAPATGEDGQSGLARAAYAWGKKAPSGQILWDLKSLTEPEETEAEQAAAAEPKQEADAGQQPDAEQEPVWGEQDTVAISENGDYLCRVRDQAGNLEETLCMVRNIDCTPPSFTWSRPDKWYEGGTWITVEATDLQPDGTPGCGLAQKAYSLDGNLYTASPVLFIEEEGSYEIWVKDRMGNIKKETVTFLHDKREPIRTPEEPAKEEKQEEDKQEEGNRGEDKQKGGKKEIPLPVPLIQEPMTTPGRGDSDLGIVGTLPAVAEPAGQKNEAQKVVRDRLLMPPLTSLVMTEPTEMPLPHKAEKKIPVTEKQKKEAPARPQIIRKEPVRWEINWKRAALYCVWMVVVICGLLWLLFALIFEHATVYKKDQKGTYHKIGRCAIIRKKEYKQINLLHVMKKGEDSDYKVCFARAFVFLHRKEKVMIRTWYGVELRHVDREIEIFSCNS